MTPEQKLAHKLHQQKLQEESDLRLAMETFGKWCRFELVISLLWTVYMNYVRVGFKSTMLHSKDASPFQNMKESQYVENGHLSIAEAIVHEVSRNKAK